MRSDYAIRSCYPELVAVIVASAIHLAVEVKVSLTVARAYNVIAVLAFGAYIVWRSRVTKEAVHVWGLRRDNLGKALRVQLAFAVPAAAALLTTGWLMGSARLRPTFWLTAAVYPFWGLAQQFALQNLLARNLRGMIANDLLRALVAALLFALSHWSRVPLVVLTFAAGFCLTVLYDRCPNLWVVGGVHGVLGAIAFHLILREDPGAQVLRFL